MKHSIRQRVINSIGLPVVKVEQVNGELGSGVLDKNGKEIFEGDLIKNPRYNPEDVMDCPNYVVVYDKEEAAFIYVDQHLYGTDAEQYPGDPLSCFHSELEIVGHVDD